MGVTKKQIMIIIRYAPLKIINITKRLFLVITDLLITEQTEKLLVCDYDRKGYITVLEYTTIQ